MAVTMTEFPRYSLSIEALRCEWDARLGNNGAARGEQNRSNSASGGNGQQLAHHQECFHHTPDSVDTSRSPYSIPVVTNVQWEPSATAVPASDAGPSPQNNFGNDIAQAGTSYGSTSARDQAHVILGKVGHSSRTSVHLTTNIMHVHLTTDRDISQRQTAYSSAAFGNPPGLAVASSRPTNDILHAQSPQQQPVEGSANETTQDHSGIVSEDRHESRELAASIESARTIILPASEALRYCKLRRARSLGRRLFGYRPRATWPCCRLWIKRRSVSLDGAGETLLVSTFNLLNPDGTKRGPFLRCILDTSCTAIALIRRSKAEKLGWKPSASLDSVSCRIRTTTGDILRALGSIRLHVQCRRTRVLVDTPFHVVRDEDLRVAEGVLGNKLMTRKRPDCDHQ